MNEALNTTAVFDTFSKAQEDGEGQAVRLLDPLHLRYFTPSELLRLFHLDISRYNSDSEIFVWPEGISTKTKYRLIGNSVNVQVVEALINFLYDFPERLYLHN
ncbi:hypothetical protein FIBSPDRAFT_967491 [Athelia psychrophila]|uniref:tRNA (cytosine(38)-C(5))-methyltransferase n=1 Tax=Athelia psychrophila TaxID=1759441 RepID=A0A167VNL1_9AGAM|nr:hypothetical protein FIBSPDRAFT_967491 [Fibularhizoctonia sp. CBS 109695]